MKRAGFSLFIMIVLALGYSVLAQDKSTAVDINALAGRRIYVLKKCGDCHNKSAKEYVPIQAGADSAMMSSHATDLNLPLVLGETKSKRKRKKLLARESAALAAYLNDRQRAEKVHNEFVTAGFVMIRENCRNCHIIQGAGKETGPNLAGIGKRHDKNWLIKHFKNPQAFVSDSNMPKFDHLPAEELEALAKYLLTFK